MVWSGERFLAVRNGRPRYDERFFGGDMQRRVLFLIGLVFAVALLVPTARSQENATITGTVTDSTGAVVPNVAISLINTATGQVRQTTSNNDGIYVFPNLGVGHYTLSASASGFQTFTRTGIVVNTDQTLKEDVSLTVGSAGQTVTVQA